MNKLKEKYAIFIYLPLALATLFSVSFFIFDDGETIRILYAFIAGIGVGLGVAFIGNRAISYIGFSVDDFTTRVNPLCHSLMYLNGEIGKNGIKIYRKFLFEYLDDKDCDEVLSNFSKLKTEHYELSDSLIFINKNYTSQNKLDLIRMLIKLVLSDRYLTKAEEDLLYDISIGIGYPTSTLERLLNLYNFVREEEHKEQTKQRSKYEFHSFSKTEQALDVLGLHRNFQDDELKNRYRELVKRYHPDKLINASKNEIEIAQEEFQKVQDAYDLLKKD